MGILKKGAPVNTWHAHEHTLEQHFQPPQYENTAFRYYPVAASSKLKNNK